MSQRLTWPLPVSWVALPALLVGAVTSAQCLPVLGWYYIDWAALSELPMGTLRLVGPVVAAAAAATSSKTSNPQTPLGCPVSARAGSPTVIVHLRTLVAAWTAAFTAGVTPFLLIGASRATAHEPQLILLAYALMSLVFFVVLGYVIGAVLPVRLAPLLAAAIASVLAFTNSFVSLSTSPGIALLLPVMSQVLEIGLVAEVAAWTLKMMLLAIVAAALAWIAASSPHVRYRPRDAAPLAIAAVALPVIIATLLMQFAPPLFVRDEVRRGTCSNVDGVSVCVEVGQRAIQPAIDSAVRDTLAITGGAPRQLVGVESQTLVTTILALTPENNLRFRFPTVVRVNLQPGTDPSQPTRQALATFLSGRHACSIVGDGGRREFLPSRQRATEISDSILAQLENRASVSDESFATWYQREQERILACDAPAVPLPSAIGVLER